MFGSAFIGQVFPHGLCVMCVYLCYGLVIIKYTNILSISACSVNVGLSMPLLQGFSGGSVVKEPHRQWGGRASVSGSWRSPVEGNGNLLQYSYLGNPMDRGAWQATMHGVPRVGHDLVTKLPPPFAITASLQILHLNEHCVELKIPWSGQRYIERNPSDSAEIAFLFQKKNRLVPKHFNQILLSNLLCYGFLHLNCESGFNIGKMS